MVKKLCPESIKANSNTLIIAARNRGKSTLAMDLLMHSRNNYDVCIGVCPTLSSREALEKITPKCFIYNEFDVCVIENLINVAKHCVEIGKPRKILLFLDDCLANKQHMSSNAIREIFLNGRHYKISTIVCCQYLYDLNTSIRSNVDYVFCLRESNPQNKKKLFQTFGGMFSSEKDFCEMLTRTTNDFECLCIDLTVNSMDPLDAISWYKADIDLPTFRVGKSFFFQIDRQFRKHNHETQLDENR